MLSFNHKLTLTFAVAVVAFLSQPNLVSAQENSGDQRPEVTVPAQDQINNQQLQAWAEAIGKVADLLKEVNASNSANTKQMAEFLKDVNTTQSTNTQKIVTAVNESNASLTESWAKAANKQQAMDPLQVANLLKDAKSGRIDGVTALIFLLIGSFFVDRVSTFILHLLSLTGLVKTLAGIWARWFPNQGSQDNNAGLQEAARKTVSVIAYYTIACLVVLYLLAWFDNLMLLNAIGLDIENAHPLLDQLVTGIILVIGAERVAQWLQLPGNPGTKAPEKQQVQISGEISIKEPSKA